MTIFKQFKANRISILIGALKEMAGRLSFYVQMGILSMSAVTFWDSALMTRVRVNFEWLNLGVFAGTVVVIGLAMIIIEYVFIMPGSYAFGTRQFNKHENIIVDILNRVEKKQLEQDEKIDKLCKYKDDTDFKCKLTDLDD